MMAIFIEFSAEPVFVATAEMRKQGIYPTSDAMHSMEEGIQQVQRNFKTQLATSNVKFTVRNEFRKIFNGIVADISSDKIDLIKSMPNVKKVYPNRKIKVLLNESVPLISAGSLWNLGYRGEGVSIAIVDTGIDYTHPDLGGCFGSGCKVAGGYDFVNNDNDPIDDMGHGTHVAATAAGNGVLKGVAPGATLYAYKVLDSGGSGTLEQVIAGIERATDPNNDGDYSDHANVISMSLGGWGDPDDPVSQAADAAVDAGAVVTIAAGNDGPEYGTVASPGTSRKAITVGASDKQDNIAYFSSRGPVVWNGGIIAKPDVVAPGVDICAAQYDGAWNDRLCLDNDHVAISGTSMATPHVAGASALLLQAHPDWTPEDVKSALMLSAKDLGYDIFTQGAGRINVFDANAVPFITSPQSIGIWLGTAATYSQQITIKNPSSSGITLMLDAGIVKDYFSGEQLSIATITPSITIQAHSSAQVTLDINLPSGKYGTFYGKIAITYNNKQYTVPYVVLRLLALNVSVVNSGTTLRPSMIAIHSRDFNIRKGMWLSGENSVVFYIPPGNYTAYSSGDDIDYALNYLLMKEFEVTNNRNGILDLAEARPFTIKARSPQGVPLNLFKWSYGVYSGLETPFQTSNGFSGFGFYGDRTLYISNRPSSAFDTDINIQYFGTPDNTGYNIDNVWGWCYLWSSCPKEEKMFAAISNSYKVATNQYSMGWVLHNIDGSTSTIVDYPVPRLSNYTYSFNYPGDTPVTYSNVFFWLPLIPKYGGGIDGASWEPFYPPLTKNYYFYWTNPVPERYGSEYQGKIYGANFTFQNFMYINYLKDAVSYEQFAYDVAHSESNIRDKFWREIVPLPEDKEHVYYGTAPLIPTSIGIDGNTLKFNGKLMALYGDKSYLDRYTKIGISVIGEDAENYEYTFESPSYQVYLNGQLQAEGNLTDYYGTWWEEALKYPIGLDGQYRINVNIPSRYPTWNLTKITAEFSKPSADMQLPQLSYAGIAPSFKLNEPLAISVNITDNSGISNVQMYYDSGNGWTAIPVTANYPVYTSTITITDPAVETINFKIIATDTSGNKIVYEIYPVSMKARNIYLDFSNLGPFKKGDIIKLNGACSDDHGEDCSQLKVKFYQGNNLLGYGPVGSSRWSEGFYWNIPLNSPDIGSISAVFDDTTGVYLPARADFTIELITTSTFTDTYTESVSDIDNDGYYDYLNIGVGVNIGTPGTYSISGSLYTGDGQEIEYSSTEFQAEAAGIYTIPLNFSGQKIHSTGKDGPYKLKYLSLEDRSKWIQLDYKPEAYTTAYYPYASFEIPPASFTDSYSDHGVDTDGDSFYDYLAIGIGVNVLEEGDYFIASSLYTTDDMYVDNENFYIHLIPGTYSLQLNFSGVKIRALAKNGPYKLKYLSLSDTNTWTEIGYRQDAYTTSYYSYTAFEKPPASFSDTYSDYVMDTDNDDLYNYLFVDVGVRVSKQGDYRICGSLFASDDTFVSSACHDVSKQGTYSVPLGFSGEEIRKSGKDGPYKLEYLELYDWKSWWGDFTRFDYREQAYTTSYYNYNDFQQRIDASLWTSYYGSWPVEVGQDIKINARVKNVGTQPIELNTVNMYKVDKTENDETETLIDRWCIGSGCSYVLGVDNELEHEFTYTPTEKGSYQFKFVLNSSEDENENNNYAYEYFDVKVPGPDVSTYLYAPQYAQINTQTYIGVSVDNSGTQDAENVNLNVYDNGVLINTTEIGNLSRYGGFGFSIPWTPTTKGYHTLRAVVAASDDTDSSNNIDKKTSYVYVLVSATFSFVNTAGENVPIYLSIENVYDGIIEQPQSITLPDVANIGLIHFVSEGEGMAVIFNNSYTIPQMKDVTYYGEPKNIDNNFYIYSVYANNVSWQYSNAIFLLYFTDYNLARLGINDSDGLTLLACKSWNFVANKCSSGWATINNIQISTFGSQPGGMGGIYGTGIGIPADAYALGRPVELSTDSQSSFLSHYNYNTKADYSIGSSLPSQDTGTSVVSGLIKGGLLIDSNSDVLTYSSAANFDWNKGTMEFWVKPNWNPKTSTQAYIFFYIPAITLDHKILKFEVGRAYSPTKGGYIYFKARESTNGCTQFWEVNSADDGANKKEPAVSQNWLSSTWHHIAIIWEHGQPDSGACGIQGLPRSGINLYIDGEIIQSRSACGSCSALVASDFRIGNGAGDSPTDTQMNATIDEFRISNSMRTKTDIFNDYLKGLGVAGPYCNYNNQIAKPVNTCISKGTIPYYCDSSANIVPKCQTCGGCVSGYICSGDGTCKVKTTKPPKVSG